MIKAVLDAIPLFWPGVLCSLVPAALLNRPVGRLLRAHWAVGFMLLLALGGVATLTLLPDTRGPFWENSRYAVQQCTLTGAGPRPLAELTTISQNSLNVALFIPVGLAAAWAGTRVRAAAVLVGAAALPFAVEYLQYVVPALGRACDAQDVWDNLFGLALGATAGLLSGPLVRAGVRAHRATDPGLSGRP
ncbi:VanZ family protein [Kitasatospora sp. NPDC004240]